MRGNGRNDLPCLLMFSSLNKDGHVVSLIANAFRADTLASQSSGSIDFGSGMTIRSISLNNAGLKIIFPANRTERLLQAKVSRPSAVRGDD